MSDTPRLALPLLAAAQAQKHVTHNEALVKLDVLAHLHILDRDLSAPPAATDGDTYLVAAGATGDWVGEEGRIAFSLDGAWRFYDAFSGLTGYVADEQAIIAYTGAGWQDYSALLSLQNVPLLGLGTTADAGNPLAAKLNNTLFTARTVGEGGDGDLRFKLNKQTAGDTLSQLYQSGFSGRAETGLLGNDDFTIKVSPDGVSWFDAIVVDKDTGYAGFGHNAPAFPVDAKADTVDMFNLEGHQDVGSGVGINFGKARGTLAAPVTVLANDTIGVIRGKAFNGSEFKTVSNIRSRAVSISGGNISGQLEVALSDTTGAIKNRLIIDDTGRIGFGTAAPAERLHVQDGNAIVSQSANAARNSFYITEEELTGLTGATVDSTIQIPDRAIVLCVSARTTTAIAGATSYDCGIAAEPSKFGGGLNIAAGSTNLGVIGPTAFYAATPIRLTANGGGFAAGAVRIAIHYYLPQAPQR